MSYCASTSLVDGNAVVLEHTQGCSGAQGLGPWSACCVENLQGCAETERARSFLWRLHWCRAGVWANSSLPATCFPLLLHPSHTCRNLMDIPIVRCWHRAEIFILTCRMSLRSRHGLAQTHQQSSICGCCTPLPNIAPFQAGTLSAFIVSGCGVP